MIAGGSSVSHVDQIIVFQHVIYQWEKSLGSLNRTAMLIIDLMDFAPNLEQERFCENPDVQ